MAIEIRTSPLVDHPIVPTQTQLAAADRPLNINGPSLIRMPDWVPDALGRYYLYYADHKGSNIELAYADALAGPWSSHEPGALQLCQTPFLQTEPAIPEGVDHRTLASPRAKGVPSPLDDCTIPHIASPEVIVDESSRTIRLYYHGLDSFAIQPTRVATSHDGLHFEPHAEVLSAPYLRVFPHAGAWYGLAMPGQIYRSANGLTKFESGPSLFEPNMRHAGVWLRGDSLWVFWTRVGDAPERILLSTVDLRGDWMSWRESEAIEVRRPVQRWEGASLPVAPSHRSSVDHPVNQLRDPFIYLEKRAEPGDDSAAQAADQVAYLVYAVAGESGLGIARLDVVP